jgi:hypothetical protein
MKNVLDNFNLGNIQILGQFAVQILHLGGVKNCLANNFCNFCRRIDKYYITITT